MPHCSKPKATVRFERAATIQTIRPGRMQEQSGVAWGEEPRPFQEFEATCEVAEALAIPITAGERDTSLPMFSERIRRRELDIVEPHPLDAGGLIHKLRVARMAAVEERPVIPHALGKAFLTVYQLHLAAMMPNLGARIEPSTHPGFCGGIAQVPQSLGWTVENGVEHFAGGAPVFARQAPRN